MGGHFFIENRSLLRRVLWIVIPIIIAVIWALIRNSGITQKYDADKEVYTVSSEDVEMNLAIRTARSKVNTFIQRVKDRDLDLYSVKVPIRDGKETEHFWLKDTKITDSGFWGVIDNDAEIVKNVKYGDSISVMKDSISDWLYIENGVMFGNFTLRAANKLFPDEKDIDSKYPLSDEPD
jgi:uncharacterized protein YegJ (DUF2314 family)